MNKNNEFAWLASQSEEESVKPDIVYDDTDLTFEEFVNKLVDIMNTHPEVKDFKMSGVFGRSLERFEGFEISFKYKTIYLKI